MENNKLIIRGNLGNDPKVTYYDKDDSRSFTTFSIAINQDYFSKKENKWIKKDDPIWLNIVCFGNVSERASERLSKGNFVAVEGRLQQSNYETKSGDKVQSVQVVCTDFIKEEIVAANRYNESELVDLAPEA